MRARLGVEEAGLHDHSAPIAASTIRSRTPLVTPLASAASPGRGPSAPGAGGVAVVAGNGAGCVWGGAIPRRERHPVRFEAVRRDLPDPCCAAAASPNSPPARASPIRPTSPEPSALVGPGPNLTVSTSVTNSGRRSGREVVLGSVRGQSGSRAPASSTVPICLPSRRLVFPHSSISATAAPKRASLFSSRACTQSAPPLAACAVSVCHSC